MMSKGEAWVRAVMEKDRIEEKGKVSEGRNDLKRTRVKGMKE